MNDVFDQTETLLAYLVCAGSENTQWETKEKRAGAKKMELIETDVSKILGLPPMTPSKSYTFQSARGEDGPDKDNRLYSTDPNDLLNPVQDIIGKRAEIAMLCRGGVLKWTGFRRLMKLPRGAWCASTKSSFYELHYREISHNGRSEYFTRVIALNSKGNHVPCIVPGTSGDGGKFDATMIVLAASLIEDAHRSNALTATVTESSSIVFPVPIGEHKELFALRDAPLTPSGKRKAILHWVASHYRKTPSGERLSVVKEHLRGVREFSADGLTVRLETNHWPT